MTCDRWEAVAVPFPFRERVGSGRRPAIVVSARPFNGSGHYVMCMIITRSEPAWPTVHSITDLSAASLPAPSIVRMKLCTLDAGLIEKRLGRFAEVDRCAVRIHMHEVLSE